MSRAELAPRVRLPVEISVHGGRDGNVVIKNLPPTLLPDIAAALLAYARDRDTPVAAREPLGVLGERLGMLGHPELLTNTTRIETKLELAP